MEGRALLLAKLATGLKPAPALARGLRAPTGIKLACYTPRSTRLRAHTVRDFAEMFPVRFNNKTNGVTPRRWLRLANPELSRAICRAIGANWITNLEELRRLRRRPSHIPRLRTRL